MVVRITLCPCLEGREDPENQPNHLMALMLFRYMHAGVNIFRFKTISLGQVQPSLRMSLPWVIQCYCSHTFFIVFTSGLGFLAPVSVFSPCLPLFLLQFSQFGVQVTSGQEPRNSCERVVISRSELVALFPHRTRLLSVGCPGVVSDVAASAFFFLFHAS